LGPGLDWHLRLGEVVPLLQEPAQEAVRRRGEGEREERGKRGRREG